MKIHFELTSADIGAYQKYVTNKNQKVRKWVPIAIMVGILAYVLITHHGDYKALSQWLPLIAGLGVFYYLQSNFQSGKTVAQWLKNHPDQVGKREVELNDSSLTYTTPDSTTTHALNSFQKVEEREDYIYLFKGENSAVIIPKRAFSDDAQKDELVKKLKKGRS